MIVQNIQIDKIVLTENTRKQISKEELSGLKESINSVGLLQPIGLVEKNGKYELVWGFRRLEAFKQLDRKEIPAAILKDVDTRGLKIIENMQRQDITPLELAAAIKTYQEKSKLNLSDIAPILGKSLRQVSQLNKLNELIEPLQKKLSAGVLELDAALFITRYPKSEQIEFEKYHRNKTRIILNNAKEFFDKRNIKLKTFPWALDKTFPRLPQCNQCPDRSSQQNVLFPQEETPDDTCLNTNCLQKKIVLNLNEKISEAKKNGKVIFLKTSYYPNHRFAPDDKPVFEKDDYKQAGKNDKDAIQAVIVASDSLSDIGQVHLLVEKREDSFNRSSSKPKIDDLSPELQKKRRLENYKRKKDLLLFPMHTEIGKLITAAFKKVDLKKVTAIPVEALEVIADYVIERADFSLTRELQKIWQSTDGANLEKIYRILVAASTYESFINVNDEGYSNSDRYRRLRAIAPVLGIDLPVIEKSIKPKYDEKVNTLKEKFIARNKFDPEQQTKSTNSSKKKSK